MLVVFGQSGRIRVKLVLSDKVVVIGKKWLYSGKVIVYGQIGGTWAKMVVL